MVHTQFERFVNITIFGQVNTVNGTVFSNMVWQMQIHYLVWENTNAVCLTRLMPERNRGELMDYCKEHT